MSISNDVAFFVKTLGGLATMAGGTMLFVGSVGRVCYARNEQGQYTLESEGLSLAAAAAIASSFFYTGFSLTGKIISPMCEQKIDAVAKRTI